LNTLNKKRKKQRTADKRYSGGAPFSRRGGSSQDDLLGKRKGTKTGGRQKASDEKKKKLISMEQTPSTKGSGVASQTCQEVRNQLEGNLSPAIKGLSSFKGGKEEKIRKEKDIKPKGRGYRKKRNKMIAGDHN